MPLAILALLAAAATSSEPLAPPPAPPDGPPPAVRTAPAAPRDDLLGVQLGAGFPQGFTAAVVVRPVPWAHLHGGFAHNVLGPGIQGGVTFAPWQFAVTPTFTFELGRFFATDVSGRFSGTFPRALDPALRRFGYDFYATELGLEVGSRNGLLFFLRGGLAWVRSGLDPVSGERVGNTVVDVLSPRLRATVPTVDLGFILFVW